MRAVAFRKRLKENKKERGAMNEQLWIFTGLGDYSVDD